MDKIEVKVRKATPEDATFVAWGLATAVGASMDNPHLQAELPKLVYRDDVLYSWKNASIAMMGEERVGVTIAYNGATYPTVRLLTFQLLKEICGADYTKQDDETKAGELYIDTLAVTPQYRGRGIGRILLYQAIEQAHKEGYKYASLAVHPENLRAQNLYTSLGFERANNVFIFEENYWRMLKRVN